MAPSSTNTYDPSRPSPGPRPAGARRGRHGCTSRLTLVSATFTLDLARLGEHPESEAGRSKHAPEHVFEPAAVPDVYRTGGASRIGRPGRTGSDGRIRTFVRGIKILCPAIRRRRNTAAMLPQPRANAKMRRRVEILHDRFFADGWRTCREASGAIAERRCA